MAIFCAQCGKETQDEARFCSACGTPLNMTAGPQQATAYRSIGTLTRARIGRKVAGVCQGLANHYGWDVTVVRIVLLLLAIVGFPIGLVIYGLIWLVAPEEVLALPAGSTYVSQG